jgi:alkyl hydroperoxide reductase subunit AhpC
MFTGVGFPAPQLKSDAFVRGEPRRTVSLAAFRGTWVVLALGVDPLDVVELAFLEEAFAADGAVVLAATPDDWQSVAERYADEPVRFPILTAVADYRRLTAVIDPHGIIRHIGMHLSARQTLASLEAQLVAYTQARAA